MRSPHFPIDSPSSAVIKATAMLPLMRDIIEVPVVKTVVRLDDAGEAAGREELVREFVITRQASRNLSVIAQSIAQWKGRGAFVIGPYGSGKSHFLSYVSLVLSGEVSPDGVSCPVFSALSGRRLFPVRVSLVKVRNETRLEDAILSEAEKGLRLRGKDLPVSRRSRFLRHVDEAIRKVDAARMDAHLAKSGFPVWIELIKNPDRAAVAAWGYAKTLDGCPVMPEMPPAELLSDVIAGARTLGFDGVAIVIDELSEFLRSKPSRAALGDDARYLQLLGETTQSEPLWIVASLQEAIERTGDISRDVIAKIRDRYPSVLPFDESHIRDLIDGRLIKKREGARDVIRQVWRRFTECLPDFCADFESFFRTYPVHPATITFLEGLSGLFSMHRGVVDFIVTQVRGDKERGVLGIIDSPADRLVTADSIYEHFRDRITSDHRFSDFDSVARRDIHRAIEKVLPDESDRQLARRAADLLILREISQIEKPLTVSDLSRMLLAVITETSTDANEQYLADVILAPVLAESLHLSATTAARAGDRIFRVTLERDRRGLLERETVRVLEGVELSDSRILNALLAAVPIALPIREMSGSRGSEVLIHWRGTRRKGMLLCASASWENAAVSSLESGDVQFAMLIAHEGFSFVGREPLPRGVLAWIPSFDDAGREAMRAHYAALIISKEDSRSVERAVKEEAEAILKTGEAAIGRIIEAGFKDGRLIRQSGETYETCNRAGRPNFVERFASEAAEKMLAAMHPKFLQIAPTVEFVSRRSLAPLVDAIIAPGRVTMAQARKNNTREMIEGVLLPMGLAAVQGPSFVMQIDPAKSGLVKEVLDAAGAVSQMSKLARELKSGEWGLSDEMFELLIAALARGGAIELRKAGRRVPTVMVNLANVSEAEEIQSGEILEPALRDRLFADAHLSRGMEHAAFSLSFQREAWGRLVAAKDRIASDSVALGTGLSQISEYPVFDSFDFERVRAMIERAVGAVENVEESQGPSKGLAGYLSCERPDLDELLRNFSAVKKFLEGDADRVIRIADYLRDLPPESQMPEEMLPALSDLKGFLTGLTDAVFAGNLDGMFGAFDRFFEQYSAWYVEAHRRAFAAGAFREIETIRESAAYRALKIASSISGLHLVDGAQAMDRRIDEALSARCSRSPSAELRLKACCACGFVPGSPVEIGSAAAIVGNVEAGISEAIAELSGAAVLEKFVARISILKEIDSQKAAALGDFFQLLRGKMAPAAFEKTLTPAIAALLGDALRRKSRIVPRDLRTLLDRISGRKLPPDRLRAIFDEWLGDERGEDVLLEVTDGSPPCPSIEEMLAAWIEDHGLDAPGASLALCVPAGTKPAYRSGNLSVDDDKLRRMAELVDLGSADWQRCIELLARERRFEGFAWAVAGRAAILLAEELRPPEGTGISVNFRQVGEWMDAAIRATVPFFQAPIEGLIRAECQRDSAASLLAEHSHLENFPPRHIVERLLSIAGCRAKERDAAFSNLGETCDDFGATLGRFPGASFLFVDAARWDIVPRFIAAMEENGFRAVEENWHLNCGASTAAWQRAFFGTDDADAIASILRRKGLRYAGNIERPDARGKAKELAREGVPLWLNTSFIDRRLHETTIPLHRLLPDLEREFNEMIAGFAGWLGAENLVLLTDHGFSEIAGDEKNAARYSHDAARQSDCVSARIVFTRRGLTS